jgi:CRISPR-associated protein Csm5
MLKDAFEKARINKNSFKKNNKQQSKITKKNLNENDNIQIKLNNKSGNLTLKLTAITPLHIGMGEVYEPTNFIIDNNILYHFKDEDFYRALPPIKQKAFLDIASSGSLDSFALINKFVKENKDIAKKAAFLKVNVTKGIAQDYESKVGQIVQYEGTRNLTKVFNRFEIQKIIRKQIKTKNGYLFGGYIAGSSLKGSIATAFQEYIFKTEGKNSLESKFNQMGRDITKNIFKNLKVADSVILSSSTKIGYALNKERFEEDDTGPYTIVEVINKGSEFKIDISYNNLDIGKILNSCNEHYLPIFKQQFKAYSNFKNKKIEEWTNEYFSDEFYEKYKDFKLKENQFLIRVGKYSQARAVTIDGLRKIRVKVSGGGPRRKPNKWETLDQETTTWMFGEYQNSNENLLPFGWMVCEIEDIKEFRNTLTKLKEDNSDKKNEDDIKDDCQKLLSSENDFISSKNESLKCLYEQIESTILKAQKDNEETLSNLEDN